MVIVPFLTMMWQPKTAVHANFFFADLQKIFFARCSFILTKKYEKNTPKIPPHL